MITIKATCEIEVDEILTDEQAAFACEDIHNLVEVALLLNGYGQTKRMKIEVVNE